MELTYSKHQISHYDRISHAQWIFVKIMANSQRHRTWSFLNQFTSIQRKMNSNKVVLRNWFTHCNENKVTKDKVKKCVGTKKRKKEQQRDTGPVFVMRFEFSVRNDRPLFWSWCFCRFLGSRVVAKMGAKVTMGEPKCNASPTSSTTTKNGLRWGVMESLFWDRMLHFAWTTLFFGAISS
jgi:hypothetical protein